MSCDALCSVVRWTGGTLALPSRSQRWGGALLALTLAVGCGEPLPAETPLAPGAVRLTIGPLELQPGQEVTKCVTAHLPTTTPIDVVKLQDTQKLSHHIIFYRELADVPDEALHSCPPLDLGRNTRVPLFIGEKPTEEFAMPPGVSFHFEAGQAYTIEGHFLNASTQPVSGSAELILTPAVPGSATIPADLLFLSATTPLVTKSYDGIKPGLPPAISGVPTETTTDPTFYSLSDSLASSKFFALTSHQHQLGTGFVITKSVSAQDPGTPLYQNSDWEHPPLLRFPDEAPLTFGFNEGFRWICTYKNTTSRYVTFGQSATTNEMCILWAYYYPGQGFVQLYL